MLTNLELHSPSAAQSFYQTYFTDILMQIFSVVTDTSHTAGLALHAQILAYMFTLVESNKITVNLGPIPDNTLFVQEYVASLLKSAFSHLTDNQIKVFVSGLFNLNQEVSAFKEHLRDFLIQIRVSARQNFGISLHFAIFFSTPFRLPILQEVTGDDDSDLYLAEREEELKNAQVSKRMHQMTVPGILGPHEQPESMQDELDIS